MKTETTDLISFLIKIILFVLIVTQIDLTRKDIIQEINKTPKHKVYYEYNVFHTIENNKNLKYIKVDTIPVDTIYIKIK